MGNPFFGLQTFGEIPEEWAVLLSAKGWGRVRVEGTAYDAVMAQCQRHGLQPLWVVRPGQEADVPSGIAVELGNEMNAGCEGNPPWERLSSSDYAAWVLRVYEGLINRGCTVYVGGANNTSGSGLQWTREVLAHLPYMPGLRVSFHRYPDGDQDPQKPKTPWHSMAEEDAALLDVVRGRKWGISEAGLLDYQKTSGWWFWRKTVTRKAVDGHRWQAERFKRLGAEFLICYQLQGSYGIRRSDGTWTAVADLPALVT